MATTARFEFAVYLTVELGEDFTEEDARSNQCHVLMEKALFSYLQKWPDYPKACDCEVMDVTIHHESERDEEYERAAAKARNNDFADTNGKDWT